MIIDHGFTRKTVYKHSIQIIMCLSQYTKKYDII